MNTRIDDLIVLATLGELTDQEAQELDRAAQADPIVAADLADALSTAATLQSAAAEAPPAGLKLSVMDAIAGLAQDPPTSSGESVSTASPAAAPTASQGDQDDDSVWSTDMTAEEIAEPVLAKDSEPKGPESAPMPRPSSDSSERSTGGPGGSVSGAPGEPHTRAPDVRSIDSARSRRRFTPWIAAAAAAVLVVVGAVVVLSGDSDDGRSAEIAAVIEADDAQPHSVAGEIGELEFVYSPSQQAFVLVGDGLQLPPEDATYQVWLVKEEGQSSLGTFEPDDDGDMEMRADGIDPSGATIGITLEPEGGSEVPTEPMVAQSVV